MMVPAEKPEGFMAADFHGSSLIDISLPANNGISIISAIGVDFMGRFR
jgi:hypothetical protein